MSFPRIKADIEDLIHVVRGNRIVLAKDLAAIYGVSTRRLNEQVRRNLGRFPDDFAFQLNSSEWANLRSQIATSSSHGGARALPWAFTEHGAIQAANILNSAQAIKMGIAVVRAFVAIRVGKSAYQQLANSLKKLESRMDGHESELRVVIDAVRQLALADEPKRKRRIGFK